MRRSSDSVCSEKSLECNFSLLPAETITARLHMAIFSFQMSFDIMDIYHTLTINNEVYSLYSYVSYAVSVLYHSDK